MNDRLPPDNLFMTSDQLENETELIPLITAEDEEQMNAETTPPELPLLPLRNTVLFPGVVIPITVGRDRSIRLIQEVYRGNKTLGVVSQKDSTIEDPRPEDLNRIGTNGTGSCHWPIEVSAGVYMVQVPLVGSVKLFTGRE